MDHEEGLKAALSDRYRIESEVGSGGMATVYLAQDLKHDRKVAVKVLKPELAAIVGAERFLSEIKTTANLQHPHVLPLFDSGEADGFLFYVMPYVEGESLREKLDREKQLPVDEAIRIAGEVADALDHAHGRGVIHRDIKPENILLHEGSAQVADFGIALAVNAAGGARLTETGLSLGTPSYMSPEQASGEGGVDARSDLYSLAAVVYEMLSGEPPHTGPTAQAIVAKILTEKPEPLRKSRLLTPPWVEEAVDRALERIPADRHASAGAFAEDLRTERQAGNRLTRPSRMALAVTALITASVTAGVMKLVPEEDNSVPEVLAPTAVERPLTFSGRAENIGISPDGSMVAYGTERGLVTRDIRGGQETLVLAVDDPRLGQVHSWSPLRSDPRWLPDNSAILFTATLDTLRLRLTTVPRMAGDGEILGDVSFESGEPIVVPIPFADGSGRILLVRVLEPETSAPWIRIWKPQGQGIETIDLEEEAGRIWDATVSPNGQWIAYVAEREDRSTFIGTVSTDGSAHHRILEGHQELSKWSEMSALKAWPYNRILKWVAGDRLDFRKHGSGGMDLWRVQVNPESGERQSQPRLVYPRLPRGTSFDISEDAKTLAFTGGPNRAHVHLFEIDRNGGGILRQDTVTRGTGWNVGPRISSDGTWAVFVAKAMSGGDLFLSDLVAGTPPTRLNMYPRPEALWIAVWSPEGDRLAAHVETDEGPRIWIIDLANGTTVEVPGAAPGPMQMAWSPDGRYVLFGSTDGGYRVLYDLQTNEQRRLFESVGGELIFALFSPDGSQVLTHEWSTNTFWVESVEGNDLRQGGKPDGVWPRPVWWGPDGTVMVLDILGRTLTEMPWDGDESRLIAELPVECIHEGLSSMDFAGRILACSVRDWESDVTVVENFDPEVAAAAGASGG